MPPSCPTETTSLLLLFCCNARSTVLLAGNDDELFGHASGTTPHGGLFVPWQYGSGNCDSKRVRGFHRDQRIVAQSRQSAHITHAVCMYDGKRPADSPRGVHRRSRRPNRHRPALATRAAHGQQTRDWTPDCRCFLGSPVAWPRGRPSHRRRQRRMGCLVPLVVALRRQRMTLAACPPRVTATPPRFLQALRPPVRRPPLRRQPFAKVVSAGCASCHREATQCNQRAVTTTRPVLCEQSGLGDTHEPRVV